MRKMRDAPCVWNICGGSRFVRAARMNAGWPAVPLLALVLTGCAHGPPTLVPLAGAPMDDLSRTAVIVEDENRPALLRGLDGKPLQSMRVPNAFSKYAYVVSPGSHTLWLKSAPAGVPWLPQRVRCYVLRADLASGARYVLREDAATKRAQLSQDGGGITATGELVDEPWVFARECRWR